MLLNNYKIWKTSPIYQEMSRHAKWPNVKIQENKGIILKYRKIQEQYKNRGTYRKYRNATNTEIGLNVKVFVILVIWNMAPMIQGVRVYCNALLDSGTEIYGCKEKNAT